MTYKTFRFLFATSLGLRSHLEDDDDDDDENNNNYDNTGRKGMKEKDENNNNNNNTVTNMNNRNDKSIDMHSSVGNDNNSNKLFLHKSR